MFAYFKGVYHTQKFLMTDFSVSHWKHRLLWWYDVELPVASDLLLPYLVPGKEFGVTLVKQGYKFNLSLKDSLMRSRKFAKN